MEVQSYAHGVPCWVDLGTSDPEKAAAFYGELWGWDAPPGPPEAGGYAIASLRGRPVAGIGPQMNPGPPVWATYVNVDDADKVVPLVAANGGSVIVPPMDVLDVGRMAVFSDPAGAVISIWQARAHIGAGIVNEPGTLSWNELQTTDIPGAKTFYGAVFGWDSETHGEGPMAYTEWKIDGRSIGGMMAKPPNIPAEVPPFWGVYFAVTDADATTDQIRELDGTIVVPPMDIEPGRFGVATDPTGAMFNFIAMRETA